jgi:hypothetical protein
MSPEVKIPGACHKCGEVHCPEENLDSVFFSLGSPIKTYFTCACGRLVQMDEENEKGTSIDHGGPRRRKDD